MTEAPGLFFCGLSFQYAFSSIVLPGVGRDADFVVVAQRPEASARQQPATVARYLSNILTKLDVSSRTAAAAYAFAHELV